MANIKRIHIILKKPERTTLPFLFSSIPSENIDISPPVKIGKPVTMKEHINTSIKNIAQIAAPIIRPKISKIPVQESKKLKIPGEILKNQFQMKIKNFKTLVSPISINIMIYGMYIKIVEINHIPASLFSLDIRTFALVKIGSIINLVY